MPGQLAVQLASHLGNVHCRLRSATLGLAFMLPSFFMVMALAGPPFQPLTAHP